MIKSIDQWMYLKEQGKSEWGPTYTNSLLKIRISNPTGKIIGERK